MKAESTSRIGVNKLATSGPIAFAQEHWRTGAVVLSAISYAFVLAFYFEPPQYQTFILGAFPAIVAAWLHGLSVGMIAAALVTVAHVAVVLVVGESAVEWLTGGGGLGTLTTVLSAALIGRNTSLRLRIARERKVLLQTQDVTVFALAYQAELRDQTTGKHLERTAAYVETLARELALRSSYSDYLTKAYVSDLVRAAPLHDIGKVGIPDSILLKPGKLTPMEFAIMQEHCELGAQVLRMADEKLEFQSFLRLSIQLALSHHEKWDKTGYPAGLEEQQIPLSGRIMALTDVYDALRSERSYKSAIPHTRSCEIIAEGRGTHFDPEVVDAFLRERNEFQLVSTQLGDSSPMATLEELEPADAETLVQTRSSGSRA